MITIRNLNIASRRIVRIGVIITFMIIAFPGAASSEWPHQPNVNLPIAVETNAQSNQQIISDGAGGAIIVWQDYRSGSSSDIYAQRVNADGVPQWTTNGVVVCDADESQAAPKIVHDGAGGTIISWFDFRNGANFYIYAQRLNVSGLPMWADNGVVVSSADATILAGKMIADNAGGAIIVWNDQRNGDDDLYAQRINSAGVTQWAANGVAVCTADYVQTYPDIIGNGSGGAYVVWVDYRLVSNTDIYVQGINSGGNIVWPWAPDGIAVCQAVNDQYEATIVRDGSGGAFISWVDERSLGQYADIYLQPRSVG